MNYEQILLSEEIPWPIPIGNLKKTDSFTIKEDEEAVPERQEEMMHAEDEKVVDIYIGGEYSIIHFVFEFLNGLYRVALSH